MKVLSICLFMLALISNPLWAKSETTSLDSLRTDAVEAYKSGNYLKSKRLLTKALPETKPDSKERLEVLNNLWVTYLRLDDLTNAKLIKDRYDALDKKLDSVSDMVFKGAEKKPKVKKSNTSNAQRKPIKAKRELTVSGLTLRKKGDKYFVEGLLINRTKKAYRSVTIDMELTMDDANEEFETIFLKGIGPETSKNFEKAITLESEKAKPVMATVIKVNSLDFDSFDFYKPMRK